MCVAHTRRTTTTYHYLKSRLSAIDTAGFFKGEWKENYYVCGAYKKKNDNNVQLPQISAVSYRYGWFLQRSMERELLCVWRIQEEERQQRTTTSYLGCQLYIRLVSSKVNGKRTTMCVAHTRRMTTTYDYLISRLSAIDRLVSSKVNGKRTTMCVAHTRRRTTTTYNYLKSRLSAIDTAGFFKGEWKENYYVCGAYKKKNDNNVQLPQISAVSYRYGWFLQR